MSTLILIPARMASTRLPGKPMADIAGRPMIVHVAERAHESGLGRVVVATDEPAVAEAIRYHGFEAVMTRTDHQSGSDRIRAPGHDDWNRCGRFFRSERGLRPARYDDIDAESCQINGCFRKPSLSRRREPRLEDEIAAFDVT